MFNNDYLRPWPVSYGHGPSESLNFDFGQNEINKTQSENSESSDRSQLEHIEGQDRFLVVNHWSICRIPDK